MFGVFVNIYYYHYQIAYTSYQVFIMDDNSFDGLDSLDFNTDMYYEDEWSNIGGNLNTDNLDNASSSSSNSPKIKFSRSNSKDVLGGTIDFANGNRNIASFLENNKGFEQALRVPGFVSANSPSKRKTSLPVSKSSKRRNNNHESPLLNNNKNSSSSSSTNSIYFSKKKTAGSSSKRGRNSKKSLKNNSYNRSSSSSSLKLSSNSKSTNVNSNKKIGNKKIGNKNRVSDSHKGRNNLKDSKKPAIDSKEEIRRRRKNIREKERRQEVNDGFTVLMNLVGLHCQSDKARILNAAADTIQNVCETNELYKKAIRKLKHENETLRRVTKQYIYKLTLPIAEIIKRNNGEITAESKKQMEDALAAEQRKLQQEICTSSGSGVEVATNQEVKTGSGKRTSNSNSNGNSHSSKGMVESHSRDNITSDVQHLSNLLSKTGESKEPLKKRFKSAITSKSTNSSSITK